MSDKKLSPVRLKNSDAVFDVIVNWMIESQGLPPTVREIRKGLGGAAASTVMNGLRDLEKRGMITRNSGSNRSIVVVGSRWIPPEHM